ncbi:MAG: methyltransferase domain-containing protein [Spirochaetia bacterium]|nr:methyltransferase domain-containing protein [Spirochaetia bacterium]
MGRKKNPALKILDTIGPVSNLESYVKSEWWKEIFNANYLRTDGDVVEDSILTEKEIDTFIEILKPQKDMKILDLCCGQGRHSLEFSNRGFKNIFGIDRSNYLINRARHLNREKGGNVIFKEGDARKLRFPTDTFDIVYMAGNSFGYFETAEDDKAVLKEILRILKPSGKLLIDITDGKYMKDNFQSRSWEWIDKNYFVCRERSLSADNNRLISREVITHAHKGVIADQFYAERLYSKEEISDIIKIAGFTNIKHHADIITDSQRNMDLGMMAKRIIITANAEKEWTPIRKKTDVETTVAVLMGDPTITDIIKPSGKFDDDDFHTINELKNALKNIKNYNFIFLNHHESLINDLLKNKNKIKYAFNLCDEGFNNKATKELHVPSLLEMLDIEYTGGSPQCLAYCYDKSLVRGIAKEMDIPTPQAFFINPDVTNFFEVQIDFPVIVKPNFGDSSFGITQKSVCRNIKEFEEAILWVRNRLGYDKPVLVEQFLDGDDISVGIIGNPPESYTVLPIIKEDYSMLPDELPKICGYEAKWDKNSPYWKLKSVPANLPEETERFLIASCVKLFERLECRDYARFDWRLDTNKTPRLLEANPNPGWCWDGHLAKMAKLSNISYQEMLKMILEAAQNRIQKNPIM